MNRRKFLVNAFGVTVAGLAGGMAAVKCFGTKEEITVSDITAYLEGTNIQWESAVKQFEFCDSITSPNQLPVGLYMTDEYLEERMIRVINEWLQKTNKPVLTKTQAAQVVICIKHVLAYAAAEQVKTMSCIVAAYKARTLTMGKITMICIKNGKIYSYTTKGWD